MKWVLAILWFGGSVYAGYALTAKSFAFLKEPIPLLDALTIDPRELEGKLPQAGQDPTAWYQDLPQETKDCIRTALGEETYAAAMAGQEVRPTARQAVAVTLCLKE